MAYVYRHIRLDKNQPFYIGVGGLSNFDNYNRANNKVYRSKWWKNIVSITDYNVEILFDGVSKEFALEKEKELISLYGRKDLNSGILVNLTDGGEGDSGYFHTEETKLKLSEIKKGRKPSKKTIEAVRKANKGRAKTESELKKLSKIILDINTGVYYIGTKEVANLYDIKQRTLMEYLNGTLPNKTPFRYANIDGIKEVNTKSRVVIKTKGNHHSSKLILDLQTGIYYDCVSDFCDAKQETRGKAYQQLRGKNKNTLNIIYA